MAVVPRKRPPRVVVERTGQHSRRGTGARPYLLNVPAVVVLLIVVAYPMVSAAWLSLHDVGMQATGAGRFVGLGNYEHLLHDPGFWSSLQTTVIFLVGAVVGTVGGGLLLALVANLHVPGRGVLRTVMLIPWAFPPIVTGLMWQWIFDGQVGVFNAVLHKVHLISHYHSWLADSTSALAIVTGAQAWNFVPITAIFVLAALQAIPNELYDAAAVDGAGRWKRFRYVTLPWLGQPLMIVLLLQTILALRVFDLVYVLTGGGPGNATTVLAWRAYVEAFTYLHLGVANAYAYVIALIGLVLAVLYVRMILRMGRVDA